MMYYQTWTGLQKTLGPLAEPAYNELLEQEEQFVGWDSVQSCRNRVLTVKRLE